MFCVRFLNICCQIHVYHTPVAVRNVINIHCFVFITPFTIFRQGFWSRFFPIYNHLRGELASKSIGDVHTVVVNFGGDLRQKERLNNLAMGPGALMDVGCYPIQLATMIFNERPERICASGILSEGGGWSAENLIGHFHYSDVILSAMSSQITSIMIVYSTVYSGTDQRKH